MGDYATKVLEETKKKNPYESEYLQAVAEVLTSIAPIIKEHAEFEDLSILERIIEPERIITFRVPWIDDKGKIQVNRGYRVQYSSLIGPYKGGIRFHPSVNQSIMKFLGFEQVLKNALTGLPIGGGKGGSDFDPKGKSDMEVMRFCQSFMNELFRHIGPDTDVPAGDIGVGAREIGFFYGQYKKISNTFSGILTGKGLLYGGSLARTEATGYGLIYYTTRILQDKKTNWDGKKVIISGSGNVAIYATQKAQSLGAKVIALSDSNGYIVDEEGIDLAAVKQIKEVERARIKEYLKVRPKAVYAEGSSGIWSVSCDVALPCATQNELDGKAAEILIKNGVMTVAEGANMPCTPEAIERFQSAGIAFGPAKAANAGGVATSSLEMSQNSMRLSWPFEEVDAKLHGIMNKIYDQCKQA